MSVALLNNTTIKDFINDTKIFDDCVKESFKKLDMDRDGVLNANELRVGFHSLTDPVDDLSKVICHKFNVEKSGGIGEKEFKSVIREILIAMADGIGNFPVQVALQQDSFLMKAVEHEKAKEENCRKKISQK